jgi:hypothetical protein
MLFTEVSMSGRSLKRSLVRFGLMLVLSILILGSRVAYAQAEQIFMSIRFSQALIGIGQTVKLDIVFSNAYPNPIRVTSLQCTQSGTSVTASAISPIPNVVGVEATYEGSQTYRGVATGTTTVHCDVTAVDTVTGATYTATSPVPATIDVIPQMGLYFTAYSATRVATVGQSIFVISKFGNRGKTAFTNLTLSCAELGGRSIRFVSGTPMPLTIPPGQSRFVEDRWVAFRKGDGSMICSLTATESVSGKQIILFAPIISITVK